MVVPTETVVVELMLDGRSVESLVSECALRVSGDITYLEGVTKVPWRASLRSIAKKKVKGAWALTYKLMEGDQSPGSMSTFRKVMKRRGQEL